MKPEIWGPHAWIFMHSVTFDYPDNPTPEIQNRYKLFFESLQYVLPCELCRNHYTKNLKKFPINNHVLKTRKNLIEWLIDLHNNVNKSNKKPKLSYKEVVKKYLDYYEGKKDTKNELLTAKYSGVTSNLIIIISILVITIYILKRRIFL
jgi:hypothetical protein